LHKIPGKYSIVTCENCGFSFTNPRPFEKDLGKFYTNSPYFKPTIFKKSVDVNKGIKQFLRHIIFREYFNYYPTEKRNFLEKIIVFPFYLLTKNGLRAFGTPNFVKNGKLLDIGCAWGLYLNEMKQTGWNVQGNEIDKKCANWAKKNLGINVESSPIEKSKIKDKFDVVATRMTLEHVYYPKAVINNTKKMLKKNGELIITIPNFGSNEVKIFKEHAYTLQIPTHLNHFTPKKIKDLLKSEGFSKIKIIFWSNDNDVLKPLEYIKEERALNIQEKLFKQKFLRKVYFLFDRVTHKSSRMTIFAKFD
jgi:2-polyprenyl-3-methyl-5-hydroxy-6-metoxy-1,4-benzoquinol methylase